MIISKYLCKQASGKSATHLMRRVSAEDSVMKEVISEILQRKEQQEEDLYFETLNREVIAKMNRQVMASDSRATAPPMPMVRKSIQ